jgi:hypothetical protein
MNRPFMEALWIGETFCFTVFPCLVYLSLSLFLSITACHFLGGKYWLMSHDAYLL